MQEKSPSESKVTMTELVLPGHTNALGSIFGGQIMAWIDIAAATSAMRHSRMPVVTASIDALNFLAPVKLGHIVHIQAMLNAVSRTSMEVGVRVDSEDPLTGDKTHCVSAYTTFVGLSKDGKPSPIPGLKISTPDEKRRADEAKKRREARIKLKEELSR